MYEYKGSNPCPKCDGTRTNWRKGSAWTRPADNSAPWWPTEPCNLCGGTGRAGQPFTTIEELVDNGRAKLKRRKALIQRELDKLNAMGVA